MPPLLRKNGSQKRIQERLKLVTARHKIYLWPEGGTGNPLSGFGFVSDFSDMGVGIYVGEKLKVQTPVTVAFEDPKSVSYRGHVMWSSRLSPKQNFFGHDAPKYRIGIKLIFGTEAERLRYEAYYNDVLKRVLQISLGI